MLRKVLPCRTMVLILSFTALISCDTKKRNDDTANSQFSFDTARAAQSVIPIQQAIAFQKSFLATRSQLGKMLPDTNFLPQNFNLPNGEAFTKDALLLLLSQKGADGIRFYYGKDRKGVVRLVLLPVTKDGKVIYNKLITSARTKQGADSGVANAKTSDINDNRNEEAVETGQTCPPCLIEP